MRKNKLFLLLPGLCLFLLMAGCSYGMSSSNYWKGAAKEVSWVNAHYKHNLMLPQAADSGDKNIEAFHRDGYRRFRIGIVISGDYWEFFENFKGLVEGFSEIDWANKLSVPTTFSHCDELVSWVNSKKYSDFIEIVPEYFVNLQWGDNEAEFQRKYFGSVPPQLDAIIAYGGMAAKAFYNKQSYPVPVLSDAITDCVEAGVTKTIDDSGKDFFTNKIDPDIYKQQLRLFHDIVGFDKLGIIYGNDEYGLLYGAVNSIESVAAERSFQIVRNTDVKEFMDDDTPELYLNALRKIVKQVDAVYIGASTAVTEYNIMPQIVAILNEAKVPSFSLEGTVRVKDGILFSLSTMSGMKRSGIWMANKLARIFAGESPRAQSQRFESLASLAVNLDTARKIGYKVPMDLLVNSDEIYIDTHGTLAGTDVEGAAVVRQSLLPCKRADGKKFRIAVVESGEYWEFTEHLKGIVKGLTTNGWIKLACDVSEAETVSGIYQIFSQGEYSNYIEFPPEYFVNLDWDSSAGKADFLFAKDKPDVDLIIGFGGIAGKLFARMDSYPVPVLLEGITDPVGSGIVYSVNDSGRDFMTCRVDQTQYQRQVLLFHDFTGFKKLGIVYGDDEYGRLYGAVNDVELAALKMGFEIVRNTNVKETVAPDTVALYLAALRDVCSRSDAVYIGASTALTEYDIMPQVRKILEDAKIPSFALEGDIRVREGVLFGVSSLETEKIGLYNADKIASMLYGEVPRLLSQKFVGVPSIAMNLDMANKIGYEISLASLATMDQIYGEKIR